MPVLTSQSSLSAQVPADVPPARYRQARESPIFGALGRTDHDNMRFAGLAGTCEVGRPGAAMIGPESLDLEVLALVELAGKVAVGKVCGAVSDCVRVQ